MYVRTYVCVAWFLATYITFVYLHCVYACVQESALARQSLYVKFDPLVGGNTPKRHFQGAALRPKTGYVSNVHKY